MYLPYLRGKQNELIALRELASQKSVQEFMRPIIEPVNNRVRAIRNTIEELNKFRIIPFIALNPRVGSCTLRPDEISEALKGTEYIPLFILQDKDDKNVVKLFREANTPKSLYLACGLNRSLQGLANSANHILVEKTTPTGALRELTDFILIEDGFRKHQRNADYPAQTPFSENHLSYSDSDNCYGFSDYTIAGSDYSESGGPAYVVTIHTSYIDRTSYDEMLVRHFSSHTNTKTPSDPARKFGEALNELIHYLEENPGKIQETQAIIEFKALNQRGHFPGLGIAKKLSIMHHIQTICDYLTENR